MTEQTLIVGGGMTGLAAGMASGLPVLEAAETPGGICSSYYLRPGDDMPSHRPPSDGESYHFEIGGGHWIFGGDPTVLNLLHRLVGMKRYQRRSSVFFPERGQYVPYPIQNNLRFLERALALQALSEMAQPTGRVETMLDWLNASFGSTLTEQFFGPFHELYTAGLYRRIAPQDPYKSPLNLDMALRGAFSDAPAVGYNTTFLYPCDGLDALSRRMADQCRIEYGCRVAGFDVEARALLLDDGSRRPYANVISTLPLNRAMEMAGLEVDAPPDPHTAVLVVNIGATRGAACPDDHWLYLPSSQAGFHRVGFYSNVDAAFLPRSGGAERVSLYVERAFAGDAPRPDQQEVETYSHRVVDELVRWGFIEAAEVVHPTWIDVAYTWNWPGSRWQRQALEALQQAGIHQVGRYGRWIFQGIADSIRDGLIAGGCFRPLR